MLLLRGPLENENQLEESLLIGLLTYAKISFCELSFAIGQKLTGRSVLSENLENIWNARLERQIETPDRNARTHLVKVNSARASSTLLSYFKPRTIYGS